MQGNATKCQVLLSAKEKFISKTDSAETENSESEKLLRVTIDYGFDTKALRITK